MCRLGLSRTFQIPRPFPKMSSLENVLTAAIFGNKEKVKDPYALSRELLEFVEFSGSGQHYLRKPEHGSIKKAGPGQGPGQQSPGFVHG